MNTPRFRLWSSVGKKILTGLTGIALMAFIVMHLLGNLTLLVGADAFNGYTESLHELGWLVIVAELGLIALFGLHAISAVQVWLDKGKARKQHNSLMRTKGAPSKQTIASRSMIVTGAVLLVFVVVHVIQFRFGPSIEQGYVAVVDGAPARDLHRLVVETFKNPVWTGIYVAVMLLLGFWSAFQSIGALGPKLRPLAYSVAVVFAVAMAVGFLILPLYLFLFASVPSGAVAMAGH